MSVASLGRLQSYDPRDVWASEADDFMPWLTTKENLALLGDTVSLELDPLCLS